ncbi:MAG TPA: hypothetical protein PK967_19110, partial [Candidatus Hydrogenedentes bacterium]|nr:hypothetical protein [Candidatus Hydrogenedentota bacterium]
LIGDEFKTARKHLIAALPGDSAFKRGRAKPDNTLSAIQNPQSAIETRPPAFSGDETGGTQGGAS